MKQILLIAVLCLLPLFSFAEEYTVSTGDVLIITVYDNDDLKTTVRVSDEGTIVVPLLGKVMVKGLSITHISEKLTAMFADGYLKNPQVNVFIEEYRGQKVVILGQINQPGLYELQGTTSLLELLSKAGGVTTDAGSKAIIKRKAPKDKSASNDIVVVDMINLLEKGDLSQNIPILDGDNIFINKAGFFYVTGEVKKPDSYKLEPQMTMIQAISKAGGFSGKADKNSVKIYREQESKEKITLEAVKPDALIMENDVIVIPESFF